FLFLFLFLQSFTGLAGHGPSDTHVGSHITNTALLHCCPAQPLCHPTRDTFTLPLCMPPAHHCPSPPGRPRPLAPTATYLPEPGRWRHHDDVEWSSVPV